MKVLKDPDQVLDILDAKLKEMRRMIECVSYGPYVELFARQPHPGWDVWGDEVEGIALGSVSKK